MNTLTLALNKLEAAYDLIADALHELAVNSTEKDCMGHVATLTWLSGDLATVIKELEKEAEE